MILSIKFYFLSLFSIVYMSSDALPSELGNAIIMEDEQPGKITACELEYDKTKNVAAHKTLACGTKVRVTVLETNKSVEVTIVDRGPYAQGQIIALSSNAAAELGMIKETRVKVEVLDNRKNTKKSTKTTSAKSSGLNVIKEAADIEKGGLYKMQVMQLEPKGWGVQVAAYSSYESVIQQLTALQNNWFKGGLVYVDQNDVKVSYKIIMGPFFSKEEAESYCNSVKQKYKVKDAFVIDLSLLKGTDK